MKSLRKHLFVACIAFSPGGASANPIAKELLTFTRAGVSLQDIGWGGVAGRTYFIQRSNDMATWNFAPVMRFGTTPTPYRIDIRDAPKRFFRIRRFDANWVSTLQEARDADFDADGIPNYYEIEDLFSDPFDRLSNGGDMDNGGRGDGLSDGWELFFFGNLTAANPSAVGQPDGLTNKEKSGLGLNPNTDYSDPNATQPSKFTYDLTGRLTSVTAPVGTATYTPDEEGNILTTN